MTCHRGAFLAFLIGIAAPCTSHSEQIRIGPEARVAQSPRSDYSRYVNWRPADDETVALNPPRISWPYWPDWPGNWNNEYHNFRLQISANPDCSRPLVDVSCDFNFYNCLPELKGASRWYWRVGYDVGTGSEQWSAIRSFTIAGDAVVWDRARLARPELAQMGHPRILLHRDNLEKIRQLGRTDPGSRAALEGMRRRADRVLEQPWWAEFPKTDRQPEPEYPFYAIAHDLALVAFVWRITGDAKYLGVVDRAVAWATYPPGGRASPEGLGGDGSEDATQGNEFLALLFDWLYDDLTEANRKIMIDSLTWRVDHIMNRFAWRGGRSGGPMIRLTFGPDERVDRQKGGDQRLSLAPSDEWNAFSWEVKIPAGADRVNLEIFNYYAAGTVRFSSIKARVGSEELVKNGDFTAAEGDRPKRWTSSDFGTGANLRFEPAGRDGAGAVAISCKDSSQRGSWGQQIALGGAGRLIVEGQYRTEGSGANIPVMAGSLSGMISSHQYEASMDTAVCGLAFYEHSEVGRQWYELMVNYLAGVTCGHGFDECWNEGPGYGTSKCKWLTCASLYYDTTLPDAHFGRNPFYSRIGEHFCRVIPVGMDHNAWGNQNNASRGNHLAMFRKLAYLTGDGRFLFNYQQYGGKECSDFRPWIEYVLPAYYHEPAPRCEDDGVGLFPIDGWAMAATGPPSDRQTYQTGAGLILQCRPRGGYGHSFYSDGSVQLHAYGQMLNHGGGSSANLDAFAYHTMSHNTILVDGLGQAQTGKGQTEPAYGRIVGFARSPRGPFSSARDERGGTPMDYVYFAADATRCYPRTPGDYRRWGLPLDDVYRQRAVEHLERFVRHVLFVRGKYFVIFDDLAATRPARFTWLWHILPDEPLAVDRRRMAVDYRVGQVPVRLQHVSRPRELVLEDRQGLDGLVNPMTGEDYRGERKGDILCGHNLWVTNEAPAREWTFLAVVYPSPPGGEAAAIERIDDATVRVGDDVLCFDPRSPAAARADLVVEIGGHH